MITPQNNTPASSFILWLSCRQQTDLSGKSDSTSQGLAEHGFGLVYGGASIGLMGQVADTMIQHGGEAVG